MRKIHWLRVISAMLFIVLIIFSASACAKGLPKYWMDDVKENYSTVSISLADGKQESIYYKAERTKEYIMYNVVPFTARAEFILIDRGSDGTLDLMQVNNEYVKGYTHIYLRLGDEGQVTGDYVNLAGKSLHRQSFNPNDEVVVKLFNLGQLYFAYVSKVQPVTIQMR